MTLNLNESLCDAIHTAVLTQYKKLAHFKKGYPSDGDSTVLAAFVSIASAAKSSSSVITTVRSIATGTRCVANFQNEEQDVPWTVKDCHAEVLARRALRYAWLNEEKDGIETEQDEDEEAHVRWVLYISQPPCGDASMMVSSTNDNDDHSSVKRLKTSADNNWSSIEQHRCGAHAVRGSTIDPHGSSSDFTRGIVRTKPGRGVPSHSMSCSDKIVSWSCVGLDGAILRAITQKKKHRRLDGVVIHRTHSAQYCESIARALVGRSDGRLAVGYTSEGLACFPHCALCAGPTTSDRHCSGVSLVWCCGCDGKTTLLLEAINSKQGVLQGSTKSNRHACQGTSKLCPMQFMMIALNDNRSVEYYSDLKERLRRQCPCLLEARDAFRRDERFRDWVVKPTAYSHWKTS
eukprot:PhM_4_TR14753/c0_g1_i1/m.70150/K15440/TAD1, ADAT1; tRNA-specific adenosine deaminase 1